MTQILEDVRADTDTRERVQEDHGRKRCSAPQQVAESVVPVVENMLRERVIELVVARERMSSEVRSGLVQTAREVVECLRAAVAQSIVVSAARPHIKAEFQKTAWEALQNTLPEYDEPTVCLEPPPASAYSPLTVALALRDGGYWFGMVRALADEIARYAGSLVERGLLGFVVYRADQTGAYSYVLRRTTVLTDESHFVGQTVTDLDPKAPLGQRRTYTAIEDHEGIARHVTEEHVHHLKAWRETSLSSAGLLPMPPWARRVRDVIPPWIARRVLVVQGTIMMEEVHELDPVTKKWSLPRVARVWKDSPAFLLGDLVLTGWSSSDLGADASAEDEPHPRAAQRRTADKKRIPPLLLLGGGVALAAGVSLIPGVWPAMIARGAAFLLKLKLLI